MEDSLYQQLEKALSGSYTLERELGGGGMSRVYVARDLTLGRRVVVKVLPPDIPVSLSIERFRREIRLTANLQHPHIVPVLTAGQAGDLLYYTMPLVEGESLRRRLERDGRLPVSDATRIVRDVLRALAYAHRNGVAHRDIKPDNILLSEDGVLVTDFGIAKAVDSAAGSTSETLTGIGVTIGTPIYMAPEQLTADPSADHRVDVYATGLVLYECLTGELPFGEQPPHQRLAAMLTETPAPVTSLRSDVPPELSDFIQRCLQPRPIDRPASALAALELLDSATERVKTPLRARRFLTIAVAMIVALLVIGAWVAAGPLGPTLATARRIMSRPDATLHANRIIVAPFSAIPDEPSMRALGAMLADYVAQGLSVLPRIEVVDARTAMVNAAVVDRIPRLLRNGNRAVALAEETGARVVLTGHVYRDGDSLRADAVVLDAGTGRIRQSLGAVTVPIGASASLIDSIRRRALAAVMQASDTTLPTDFGVLSTPPSIEAYAAMRQGLRQIIAADSGAITSLRRAASLDRAWVMPRLLLVRAASNEKRLPLADSALTEVRTQLDLATPTERALFDMEEASFRGDNMGAHAAAEALWRLAPSSAEAQLIAAGKALQNRQPRRALAITDQMDPDRGINLGSPFYTRYRTIGFLRIGDYRRALDAALAGAKRFGFQKYGVFAMRAHAGLRNRDLRTAIERYARDTDDPVSSRAWFAEAAALQLLRVGDSSRARELARQALSDHELLRAERAGSRTAMDRRLGLGSIVRDTSVAAGALLNIAPGSLEYADVTRRGVIAAMRGDRAEAMKADSILSTISYKYDFGLTPYRRAQIAAMLGDRDRAVRLLTEADAKGYPFANVEGFEPEMNPFFVSLSGYPAFERLIGPKEGN